MVYIQIQSQVKCPKCSQLGLDIFSDTKKFYEKCTKCGYDVIKRRCGC
jgi:uncharacterized protein (DUF983 family)